MSLIKRNVNFPAFPQIFDDFFTRDMVDWGFHNNSSTNTTLPSVNIIESHDGFMVEMAAPGMEKDDFQIELDNETLTISSQRKRSNGLKEGDRYSRREFSYQAFQRTFHLPKSVVDDRQIEAKYENGILRILIPKKEEAKKLPPRTIEIH